MRVKERSVSSPGAVESERHKPEASLSIGYSAKESTCVSTVGTEGPLGPGESGLAPWVWRALPPSWGGTSSTLPALGGQPWVRLWPGRQPALGGAEPPWGALTFPTGSTGHHSGAGWGQGHTRIASLLKAGSDHEKRYWFDHN